MRQLNQIANLRSWCWSWSYPIWAIHRFPKFSDGWEPLYHTFFANSCAICRDTRPISISIAFARFFFFIHFHFYSPEQNPNPSPSAVVVINGRVLLIELPTNSVFMRLRRVHFAGLGIAVAVGFPFLSIPFHSFCSVLFRRLFGIGCGFRFGFGFGFGGVTQQGSQQIEMLPPGRQEIVFNLPLRLFSGT